ncbi:hypothetical protein BY458DRAFT_530811 [Sporodiniella umbellata]|nr:hypothetical protein BY458DRAFT_530811 [Sporodiniella umbellata]
MAPPHGCCHYRRCSRPPVDISPSATAELDAIRVEIIWTQILKKKLNTQTVEDLLAQKLAPNACQFLG